MSYVKYCFWSLKLLECVLILILIPGLENADNFQFAGFSLSKL